MGNSITQKLKYKQSVIKFSYKYGVTNAAIKFSEHRKTIYRWRERYDGTLESLKDKSRKPKSHPNQHTKEEIELIKKYKANNKKTGLVVLWVKLKRAGYKRTVQGLYGIMVKLGIYTKAPSKKKINEKTLEELEIKHKLIKPHTPKQNGKVERSHRKDQERFYYEKVFHSLEDLRNRSKYWINEYNNFPMRPLNWLSPNEKLKEYYGISK